MRVGGFEVKDPLPELRRPHAIVCLAPWVDVGGAASLALGSLERHLKAEALGSLAVPGAYFDFTRYRPTVRNVEGRRETTFPNARVWSARGPADFDFVLLHLLEPHLQAEEYIDSVVGLLQHLGVQRYCRVGSMWSDVPHTRPLPVMVTLNGEHVWGVAGTTPTRPPGYQGPTSIMNLVGDKMTALGVENMSIMVRLPSYARLEEDHSGKARLLSAFCSVYNIPPELSVDQQGQRQYQQISAEMERNPEAKALVGQMEAAYDAWLESAYKAPGPQLPSSVEEFLDELEDRPGDTRQSST